MSIEVNVQMSMMLGINQFVLISLSRLE